MTKKATPSFSTLRIIGGRFRSRQLPFPETNMLRPTGNRIRETVFNWLMSHTAGARCLDLFAGSGALGFEALSREARYVVFVDQSPVVCQSLRQNIKALGVDSAAIECADGLAWLDHSHDAFDIIFLDPPFGSGLINRAATKLVASGASRTGSIIYVEDSVSDPEPALPEVWDLVKDKKTGAVRYRLYRHR